MPNGLYPNSTGSRPAIKSPDDDRPARRTRTGKTNRPFATADAGHEPPYEFDIPRPPRHKRPKYPPAPGELTRRPVKIGAHWQLQALTAPHDPPPNCTF